MLQAMNGHMSLVHANFAPNENKVQGNRTVIKCKQSLLANMQEFKIYYDYIQRKSSEANIENDFDIYNNVKINKYNGYVYDAPWL